MSNNTTVLWKKIALVSATGFLAVVASQNARASYFALREQSVSYMGNAFAGTASTAEDASTGYYNPAGLSEIKHPQIVASAIYIHDNFKLYDASATNNVGQGVKASATSQPASNGLVPGLHLSAPLPWNLTVGLNVVSPFGLRVGYNGASIARYSSMKSRISTVDVSPSLAYKFNDHWSVGVGLDVLRISAVLQNAVNIGGTDAYIKNEGKGGAFGGHAGIIYKPTDDVKMGLVYFSAMSPKITGPVLTTNFPSALNPAPSSFTSIVKLPDRVAYSVTYRYDDKWTGMGEVEWTHWSRARQLYVAWDKFSSGAGTTVGLFIPQLNKNTWRVSLGANYRHSGSWLFKGGLSWDQSPVRTKYRIASLPDSNRYFFGLGVKYKYNRNLALDAGYNHVFFQKSTIQQQKAWGANPKLFGKYKNTADLVGVQVTWNFV